MPSFLDIPFPLLSADLSKCWFVGLVRPGDVHVVSSSKIKMRLRKHAWSLCTIEAHQAEQ
jgi:hypothetical protein